MFPRGSRKNHSDPDCAAFRGNRRIFRGGRGYRPEGSRRLFRTFATCRKPSRRLGLIVNSSAPERTRTRRTPSVLPSPSGEFHPLTADTNNYGAQTISKDGKTLAAIQSKVRFELGVAPAAEPDKLTAVPLASQSPIWRWDWAADNKLIIPPVKSKSSARQRQRLFRTTNTFRSGGRLRRRALSCFPAIGAPSASSANLWRANIDGSDQGNSHPVSATSAGCAKRPWVYFVVQRQGIKACLAR